MPSFVKCILSLPSYWSTFLAWSLRPVRPILNPKVYKTKVAGTAQHIFCWLKRYKVSLINLLDLKRHRGHHLCKSQRRTARCVAADFYSDPTIHSSLPELSPLLSLHVRDWTEMSWHSHMHKFQELHGL
jgi:hypothetical protein